MDELSRLPWEKLGVGALMGMALIGAIRGWWIPGYLYDRIVSERNEAERERDKQTEIAAGAVKALNELTQYFRGRGGRRE